MSESPVWVLHLPVGVFLRLRVSVACFAEEEEENKIIKKGWETNYFLNLMMRLMMKIELFIFDRQVLGTSLMTVIRK